MAISSNPRSSIFHSRPSQSKLRCIFDLFDSADTQIDVSRRHRVEQQRPIGTRVKVLVLGHPRNTNQIALLPVPALAVVNIVTFSLEHQDELLGDVAMAPR